MKSGRRALGVAESYRGTDDGSTVSTLAGAVVRADRTVDDFGFATCTVGGRDATDAVIDCWTRINRPDIQYVFVAGVALAWYNVVDLHAIADATERPVIAISFEESMGLEDDIAAAFTGEAQTQRLSVYQSLPPRRPVTIGDTRLFVRNIGIDNQVAETVVEHFTHDARPEPLRVAQRAARRVDAYIRSGADARE